MALAASLAEVMYARYFRVRSVGAEHIPRSGAAILAANHSGTLPFDGAMLYADVLKHTDPPRVARPVGDTFISLVPFVGTFLSRVGVVVGSRGNVRRLIESGNLLMVFPEGTEGIGKRYRDRYQLQTWRVGHVELAIRYRVPVVPVAIVGAEEQMPTLARWKAVKIPYVPIVATPIPLPVRYRIYYGEPLHLYRGYAPQDSDDPHVLRMAADSVKQRVAQLIERGLSERAGVFT